MDAIMSQFAATPIPFAIGAVVAVFLLLGIWKLVKGAAKVVLILVLVAAIVGVLTWMGNGGKLPF
jgi:hypothetical protein